MIMTCLFICQSKLPIWTMMKCCSLPEWLLLLWLLLRVVWLVAARERKRRTTWARPLFQRRSEYDAYYNLLMAELRESDTDRYQGFTRLTVEDFDELLSIVKVDISGSPQFRLPIPADMRLAVTLRYLEKVVRDWLIRPETVLAFAYFSTCD